MSDSARRAHQLTYDMSFLTDTEKPNLLPRSQGKLLTKPQFLVSSRVFTTHPELGSDQGN